MNKLRKLLYNTKEIGQKAYYEVLSKELVIIIRQLEAQACGYETIIDRKDIDKFKSIVKGKSIELSKLDDFPRAIPNDIKKKLKVIKNKKVFDEFYVLYYDSTNEKLKTNKEKIREKDPILFGCFSYLPDKFFYIDSWEDEYCDLTLNTFIEKVKSEDPDYTTEKVPEMDEDFIEALKKDVMTKHERLKNTNSGNWKDKMKEEDVENKPSIFQRIVKRIKTILN